MGKDIGCCGQFIRITFICINVFFVAIGFALLALGIYLVVVGEEYEFVTRNEYASAAPILIVCGAVTTIVAIVGVIGALGLWSIVIGIYVVLVCVVVILEVIAGILGFAFRSQVAEHYSSSLETTIMDYRTENASDFQSDVNGFVDYVQEEFDCCGIGSPYDWVDTVFFNSSMSIPASCACMNNNTSECTVIGSQSVYAGGCNESLFQFIEANAEIIGGVGIAFGLVEIVGIVFGLILCCCVIKANRDEKDSWTI